MTLGKKRSNVLAEHVVCKKDYPVSPVTTSIFSEPENIIRERAWFNDFDLYFSHNEWNFDFSGRAKLSEETA